MVQLAGKATEGLWAGLATRSTRGRWLVGSFLTSERCEETTVRKSRLVKLSYSNMLGLGRPSTRLALLVHVVTVVTRPLNLPESGFAGEGEALQLLP